MQYPYAVPVSVKGVVFEEGKVWLRQNERGEWELPGGKMDEGEQPTETVVRELEEELGLNVKVQELISAHLYTVEKSVEELRGVLVLSYLCIIKRRVGDFEWEGEAGRAEFRAFSAAEVDQLNMPQFYKDAIAAAKKD